MGLISGFLDVLVLVSAVNLLFYTGEIDNWHRFGYYVAGLGMGFYVSYRFHHFKGLLDGNAKTNESR